MKKLFAFCAGLLAVLNQTAVTALAAEPEAAGAAAQTPLWLCIPFAGLLLCIAVLPLVKAEWWEAHQPHAVVFWSLLFLIPFAVKYGVPKAAETTLECIINDYLTFIVLLFGLFCVSGNITLSGDLAGSPRINVGLLALGTLLSSWIGTTGASMLMIRPIIKMNAWRKRRRHIVIFFIFMVSNMGGCLTPIGDPPLLMGFMRGVPFFWSLKLLPILIFNMVVLLFIFYHFDMKAYRKDIAAGLKPDISKPGTEVKIRGGHNLIFIIMIVIAVILSGTLPSMPMFQDAAGNVLGIHVFGEVTLSYPFEMFWATGLLSSFLDNTPTYLVFRTTAGALGLSQGMVTALGTVPVKMLEAISCGAVFMGANTYIGNAPNFMVKSIADENGIRMPSFFGYLIWSFGILVPVFIVDTLVFFL